MCTYSRVVLAGGWCCGSVWFAAFSLLLLWLQKKCWLGRGAASVLGVTPRVLQVMTDVEDKNEWKNCIDIAGVQLPTGYFFGASAGTGDLSGEWALLVGIRAAWCLEYNAMDAVDGGSLFMGLLKLF